jgi:hypothetical protein
MMLLLLLIILLLQEFLLLSTAVQREKERGLGTLFIAVERERDKLF